MENLMSLISIIIPVYNTEKYLCDCIESILNQTYSLFELILVDDGSTDSSPLICDEYAKRDDRIVVVHKKNNGVSSARNTGIDICKGKYVSFVDSDDFLHPDFLKTLYELSISNNADISQCCIKFVNKYDSRLLRSSIKCNVESIHSEDALLRCVYSDNPLCYCIACVKLFSREVIKNIRFEELTNAEDIKFCIDAFCASNKIVVCDSKMYFYFKHEGSATTSNRLLSDNLIKVFDQYMYKCHQLIKNTDMLNACDEGAFICKVDSIVEDYWIAFRFKNKERMDDLLLLYEQYVTLNAEKRYKLRWKYKIFDLSPSLFIVCRYIYRLIYKS